MISIAQAHGDALGLDMRREQVALDLLRKLKADLEDYTPGFRDVNSDGNGGPAWAGLQREYDRFIDLMHEVPDGQFRAELAKAISPPPRAEALDGDRRGLRGRRPSY